jgi:hypothetical protein
VRLAVRGGGWTSLRAPGFAFLQGNNRLVVGAAQCECKLSRISVLSD